MKRLGVLVVLLLSISLTSCAFIQTPSTVPGFLFSDVKTAGEATSNTGSSKSGSAEAMSILGWVATGDASIEAAAKKANITKIHHVDYHTWGILGIFGRLTTTVYGE